MFDMSVCQIGCLVIDSDFRQVILAPMVCRGEYVRLS